MDYKTKIGLFSFLGCLITIGSVFAAFTIDPTSEVEIDDINPDVDFDEEIKHDMHLSNDNKFYEHDLRESPVIASCYEHHQFYTPIEDEYRLSVFSMLNGDDTVILDSSLIKVFLEGSSGKKDLEFSTNYTIASNEVTIIADSVYDEDVKNYNYLVVEYHNTDPNVFTHFDYAKFTRTHE